MPAVWEIKPGFDPWFGRSPLRREWLPTPMFLPGEFHGKEHGGLQFMGLQRVSRQLSNTFTFSFQDKSHLHTQTHKFS